MLNSFSPIMESLSMRGQVRIEILDAMQLDRVLSVQVVPNRIVSIGRDYMALILKGSVDPPTDLAVGTDATVTTDGMIELVAQVFSSNITQRINISNGVRMRYLLSSSSANGNTLTEAGLFGPSPNLYMLARTTHDPIVKTASLAVNYSWDIVFSQAG